MNAMIQYPITPKIYLAALAFFLIASIQRSLGQAGANDPSFNPSDVGFGLNEGLSSEIQSIQIQPDGKVIMSGSVLTSFDGEPVNRIVRFMSDGSLDETFNVPSTSSITLSPNGILLQADGKLIVYGGTVTIGATNYRIARLNSDGSIDNSFAPVLGANNSITHVALQTNGKLLLVGVFTSYDGVARNRICRINTDGTIDPTFDPGTGPNTTINQVAVQTDGKILIGGNFVTYNGITQNFLARLETNGSLDTGFSPSVANGLSALAIQTDEKILAGSGPNLLRFNSDGLPDIGFTAGTTSGSTTGTTIQHILLDHEEKIIVSGDFNNYGGSNVGRILRLNQDGTIDGTFNTGAGAGDVGGYGRVNEVVEQSDFKLVLCGFFSNFDLTAANNRIRVESNGTLDTGYDADLPTGLTPSNPQKILVKGNGNIIVSGWFSQVNGTEKGRIAELTSDGNLLPAFAPNQAASSTIWDMAEQVDGKILVSGFFSTFDFQTEGNFTRLLSDGTLDVSFNNGTSLLGTGVPGRAIAIQPDDKILVAGRFTTYNGTTRNGIVRVNTDGTLDSSFDPGTGISSLQVIEDIQLQSDGKIIAVGNFGTYNGTAVANIVRINTDGTLDNTFDIGTGLTGNAFQCKVLPDDKIIVVGYFTSYNGSTHNRIVKLNADGTTDNTFSVGSGADGPVEAIVVQPNGKIVFGGGFLTFNGVPRNGLVRVDSNGDLDPTFDPKVGIIPGSLVRTMALQGNKLLIGGTFTSYNGIGRNRLARVFLEPSLETDSLALVSLYNATNGPGWTDNTNWLTGPVDTWEGVIVGGGRVTELYFTSNNLTGTLPAQLGQLSSLEVLFVENNQLAGNIPVELGNLTNLRELWLSDNQLTGSIPAEITNLTQLTAFDCTNNELTGSLPTNIGNLTVLEWFSVVNNNLSGPLPASMADLAAIERIFLNDNSFSGPIPTFFQTLNTLLVLNIRNNNFSSLPDLISLSSLTNLIVENNNFTFEDIQPNIGIAGFTYSPQKNVQALPDLFLEVGETLNLNYSIGGTGNQYQWYKDAAPIAGATATTYAKTFAATDVGHYYLEVTNPSAPALTLRTDNTFVDINLSAVSVSDSLALVALYNSTNGANWTNKSNWLTGNANTWYGIGIKNGRVSKITLNANNLSGTVPNELSALTALDTLVLANNLLTGTVPDFFDDLPALHYIDLGANSLAGSLPSSIFNRNNWKVLGFANNNLSGTLPTELGNLTNLVSLWLDFNAFTGGVPTEIGNLSLLEDLYIQSNQLSGEVPNTLANLINLKGCGLDNNSFTYLPSLVGLSNLTYLNVSRNVLTFESLEPNISIPGFIYSPQNSSEIGAPVDSLVQANTNYTIQINDNAPSNVYTWTKDDVAQPSITTGTLNFSPITRETVGDYQCVITNPLLPDLTFTYSNRVRAFANINGQVKISEAAGATKGIATLFKITGTGGYDTAYVEQLSTTGTFAFDTVLLDDYLLLAAADTTAHQGALPTYTGNTIFWEEADTLFVNENRDDLIVNTIYEPSAPPQGTGELFGFFQEDDGLGDRVEKTRRVGGAGVTARRAQSAGRGKETLELIAYTVTDEEGNFSLPNLPTGKYRLNIQYPGYPMDESSFVQFSIANNPFEQSIQVEATVLNGKIVVRQLVITEVEANQDYAVLAFPNPTREQVRLIFDDVVSHREVRVVDSLGKDYMVMAASQKEYILNTASFTEGIYFLKIYEGHQVKKTLRLLVE